MKRLCPTISELNAFHSAARHLNFTRASRELCVTQGAVSRHVAALEAYLGQQLFTRRAQGLGLTEAGKTYLKATLPALSLLESATAELKAQGGLGGALNLSLPPTFVTQWLFPRLGHFKSALPQVQLNLVRYVHAQDFSGPIEFDASMHYGTGNWPNADARYIIGRENSIVCSPAVHLDKPLSELAELKDATLLQHVDIPFAWQEWLVDNDCYALDGLFGPRFYQYSLIIRAAISGYGYGIVPTCLIEDELSAGTLVEAFPRYNSPYGYYLCAPSAHGNHSAFRLFGSWLIHCRDHTAEVVDSGCRFCGGPDAALR
jgi:DNA-binding transcriptional LysR family regulator